jgi:tetratricopeptide (TPR) repeat protein
MQSASDPTIDALLEEFSRVPEEDKERRAVLLYLVAAQHHALGQDVASERFAKNAENILPDFRPPMRLRQRIATRSGDLRGALQALDLQIRMTRHPREAAALYRERASFVRRHFGDIGAIAQCEFAAHKAHPSDVSVLRSLTRALVEQGDIDGFIEATSRTYEQLDAQPARAGYLHTLGLAYARKGAYAEGASHLEHALELAPESLLAAHDLRRVAAHAGDLRAIVMALQVELRRRDPSEQADVLWSTMSNLVCLGRLEIAAALSQQALECEGAPFGLLRLIENLGRRVGDHAIMARAASRQARMIAATAPHLCADAWSRTGAALVKSGMMDIAIPVLTRALDLDQQHSEARSVLRASAIAAAKPEAYAHAISLGLARSLSDESTRESACDLVLDAAGLLIDSDRQLGTALELIESALSFIPANHPRHEDLHEIVSQLADRRVPGASDAALRRDRMNHVLAQDDGLRIAALGLLAERCNEFESAILAGERLLAFPPFRARSLAQLGRLYAIGGRLHEALRVTEAELAETKSHARCAKLAHRAGELALAVGEPRRARAHFEDAIARQPNFWAARLSLTHLARRESNRDLVITCLRHELETLHPDDSTYERVENEIIELLAENAMDYELAFSILNQQPAAHRSHLRFAQHRWLALRAGQVEAAPRSGHSRLLSPLHVHGEPQVEDDVLRLALRLYNPSNDQETRHRAWRQLIASSLHHPWARSLLPGLLVRENLDSIRQVWPHLQRLSPTLVTSGVALALANFAMRLGRPRESLEWLKVARERQANDGASPLDETFGCLLGDAALASDDPALARSYFEHAAIFERNSALAKRGLVRCDEASRLAEALPRLREKIAAHLAQTSDALTRAQWALAAAELALDGGDLALAHNLLKRSLADDPSFLPTKWMRTLVISRLLSASKHTLSQRVDEDLPSAYIHALEELIAAVAETETKANLLVRLAIFLSTQSDASHVSRACSLMQRALCLAPSHPFALRWLAEHTQAVADAPDAELGPALLRRIGETGYFQRNDAATDLQLVIELASIGASSDLLKMLALRALASGGENVLALVALAQAHARSGDWTACSTALERALSRESSPHLNARLTLHLAHSKLQEGHLVAALIQASAALRLGESPESIREVAGEVLRRSDEHSIQMDALALIANVRPKGQRSVVLRRMSELCSRRELHDDAILHLHAALRDSPFDLPCLEALTTALRHMGRDEHAVAALRGRLAHARTALGPGLSKGLANSDSEVIKVAVTAQRVFELLEDPDGHYLATSLLESWLPQGLPGNGCDEIRSEPWPLPSGKIDLIHELESQRRGAGAVQVLRELSLRIGSIAPYAPPELSRSRPIPSDRDASAVIQTLATILGLPSPVVYVDPEADDGVLAVVKERPLIVVSRKILASPSSPRSREALARGLFRLACGGDGFFQTMSTLERKAVVAAACDALVDDAPIDSERTPFDWPTFEEVRQTLARREDELEIGRERLALRNLDARVIVHELANLDTALLHLEDKIALVCSGDPRPALMRMSRAPDQSERMATTATFLLSDSHIALRQRLGYHAELELDVQDLEEVPA